MWMGTVHQTSLVTYEDENNNQLKHATVYDTHKPCT